MGALGQFIPLIIIFVIFYFLLIRPQKKQQEQHKEMVGNLEVGDRIITVGGIKGVVTKLKEKDLKLRIANDVEVEILKSHIARLDSDYITPDEEEE